MKLFKRCALITLCSLCLITAAFAHNIGKHHGVTKSKKLPLPLSLYYVPTQGLVFQNKKHGVNVHLSAYIIGDAIGVLPSSNLLRSSFNARGARIYLYGKLLHDWLFAFSYEFTKNGRNLKNANISYAGFHHIILTIGQFEPFFGFENEPTDPNLNFLEAPLSVGPFSPGYLQGLGFMGYVKHIVLQTAVFGPGSGDSVTGRIPFGASVRLFYAPHHFDGDVIHLGISDWMQRTDGSRTTSFSEIPEAETYKADTLVNTGTIQNVKSYNILNLAAVRVYGPFSIQAEAQYNHLWRRRNSQDLNFYGYYITAAYILTGESMHYVYPSGTFRGITHIHHKYGAVQVLARFSGINLSNQDIRGGKENNITAGLNWFVNRVIAIKFNYIYAMAHPTFNGRHKNFNIFGLRVQAQF